MYLILEQYKGTDHLHSLNNFHDPPDLQILHGERYLRADAGPRRTGDADVAGEQRNATDGVLNNIDVTARERVIVSLMPAPEIEANALKAAFDIVLGDDRAGGRKLR